MDTHQRRPRPASFRLAVLIPCVDEEATVGDVVQAFHEALPHAEIYVFDNGSRDQTVARARDAGAHVVEEHRRGKGYVLQAMFRTVDADVYLLVDGDCTYPASAAPSLIEPILAGEADMVIGSRLHPGATSDFDPVHRLGNRLFVTLLKLLFGISSTDVLSGYRAFNRAVVQQVRLVSDGFQVDAELTIQASREHFRLMELPVSLGRRPPGSHSKLRPVRDGLAILRTMVALRRQDGSRRGSA